MKLVVDKKQRLAKMRAHTATHLLHAQLDKLLGGTRQAGSLVDEDYLRFDFASNKSLSPEELREIEKQINEIIYNAYDVEIKQLPIEEAKKLGAKAFFEEKYGDIVRVVIVRDDDGNIISAELCGGTHVSNTSQIGSFKIIGQEAVASGIKRIIAVTGPKTIFNCCWEKENLIWEVERVLGVKSSSQIIDKLNKILKELKDLSSSVEALEDKILENLILSKIKTGEKGFDVILLVDDDFGGFNFKKVVNKVRQIYGNNKFLVYNKDGNFALNIPNGGGKSLLKRLALRGGGSDYFIQGKDYNIIELVEQNKLAEFL